MNSNSSNNNKQQDLWHATVVEKVLEQLNTDKEGLTEHEAETRRNRHGANEIRQQSEFSPLAIFIC